MRTTSSILLGKARTVARSIASRLHIRWPRASHSATRQVAGKFENAFADPPANWSVEQQAFLARALCQQGLLSERALYLFMNRLLSSRELDVVGALTNDESLGHEDVREYFRGALAQYRGDESLPLKNVADLYDRVRAPYLRPRVLNQLLTLAVRGEDTTLITRRLSEVTDSELGRLRKNTIFGIAQLFIETDRPQAAADVIERYVRRHPELRPYYLEQLLKLDDKGVLSPTLTKFSAQFRPSQDAAMAAYLRENFDGVDAADRQNFERFILSPLANLRQRERNLMNVRFSSEQRETLIEIIRRHLDDGHPLSLLRLGDGEAYAYASAAMSGIDAALFQEDNDTRERHWWGAAPSPAIREDIAVRVRGAVAACDILGLPSAYRVVRDLPAPGQRYGAGRAQRGLTTVLGACGGEIPLDGKIVTEERCHQVVFRPEALADLAAQARSVAVVSCWPADQLSLPFEASSHITIPPAQKLKRLDEAEPPPLFEVYPQILTRIRETAGPGVLVLIGAGIIGKFLAGEAREGGAVAIDVGSILDYMAGLKTRSFVDMI